MKKISRKLSAIGTFTIAFLIVCGASVISSAEEGLSLNPRDLTPLIHINSPQGEPVKLLENGKVLLTIVVGATPWKNYARERVAAEMLRDVLAEMSGDKPILLGETAQTAGPAIYVGNTEATKRAGLSTEGMRPEELRVKTKDGSIYLYGMDTYGDKLGVTNAYGSAYAVYDFCERILNMRQYYDPKKGGRAVVKTGNLTVPALDYFDVPLFSRRDLWPYTGRMDYQNWRSANTDSVVLMCHEPRAWINDEDYLKNRPEIFQLEKDGKRTTSPMLCYGHPKTLETYLERIDEELKGGRKSGVLNGKTVSVSAWDGAVDCHCEYCQKLFDPNAGSTGSASKIVFAFVRKLSDALAKAHPDLTIGFLPYLNYVDIPEGAEFPAGNVVVQLCSMPGLAMFKEPEVEAHEEALIRNYAKLTGRKIQNWHYICWPAEFTNAPYVYGETIVRHYEHVHDYISGSFINGWFNPEERHALSAYVWVRTLWNYHLDVHAIYDEFATRLFGPAAAPLREIIRMQEAGWNRHWNISSLSPKNIYVVSYPREDVLKMENLFEQAYQKAGNDELIRQRLDRYKKGMQTFFDESKKYADGTAYEPLMMQKVGANPMVDGKLDDPEWQQTTALEFSRALDRKIKMPKYPTSVQAVWTPDGVTFGFRMTEPAPQTLKRSDPAAAPESWGNDNVELYFDVTGKGEGDYLQIIFDTRYKEGMFLRRSTASERWNPKGLRAEQSIGEGFWSAELFLPFAALKEVKDAQIPTTMAGGKFWVGNFTRHRVADSVLPDRPLGSDREMQRLNTTYGAWNSDQAAFGPLRFKE